MKIHESIIFNNRLVTDEMRIISYNTARKQIKNQIKEADIQLDREGIFNAQLSQWHHFLQYEQSLNDHLYNLAFSFFNRAPVSSLRICCWLQEDFCAKISISECWCILGQQRVKDIVQDILLPFAHSPCDKDGWLGC